MFGTTAKFRKSLFVSVEFIMINYKGSFIMITISPELKKSSNEIPTKVCTVVVLNVDK